MASPDYRRVHVTVPDALRFNLSIFTGLHSSLWCDCTCPLKCQIKFLGHFFLLHRFVSACSFPFYSSRFPKYESIHAFLYRSTEYHNVTAFAVFHRSFHPNSGTGDRIICHSRRLPHSDVSFSLHFVSLAFLLLPNIPFCPPVSSSLCISAS